MKIQYVAFDGKTFESEDDCLQYEALFKVSSVYLEMYNVCGDVIDQIRIVGVGTPEQLAYKVQGALGLPYKELGGRYYCSYAFVETTVDADVPVLFICESKQEEKLCIKQMEQYVKQPFNATYITSDDLLNYLYNILSR